MRPEELETLLEKLDYLTQGAELVVFAGSLPRDVEDDFYAEAIHILARQRHPGRARLRRRAAAARHRGGAAARLAEPARGRGRRRPRVPRRRGLRARARPDRRPRRPQRDHHHRDGLLRAAARGARGAALPRRRRRGSSRCRRSARATRCSARSSPRAAPAARSRSSSAPPSPRAPPRRSRSAPAASTRATPPPPAGGRGHRADDGRRVRLATGCRARSRAESVASVRMAASAVIEQVCRMGWLCLPRWTSSISRSRRISERPRSSARRGSRSTTCCSSRPSRRCSRTTSRPRRG